MYFLSKGQLVLLLEQRIQVGTNAPIVMEYGYDRLGRIQMVKDSIVTGCGNPGWSQFFAYDRWGNRAMVTGSCGDLGIEVAPVVPVTAATQTMAQRALAVEGHFPNNRWADGAGGARHDASGNVVRASGNTFFYDGEGHQTLANAGGWTWKYRYNGEGRRVGMEKWGQTGMVESRHFVYDPGGNLIAELAGTAVQGGWSPKYFGSDYLGSTRIVLNNTGTNEALVSSRHDYFPFGDEVPNRGGQFGDASVKVKFTGKERDAETGLDYFGARYFSGSQGRFTSPDPLLNSGRPWEPQSWNRYAYTLNNPLRYTDPTGLYEWDASLGGSCTDKALKGGGCSGFTKQQGKDIASERKDIRKQLSKLDKSKNALLHGAATAIGKENVDNGVTIGMAAVTPGAVAQVSTTLPLTIDANGNPELDLTVATGSKGNGLFIALAHEGTHVADAQAVAGGAPTMTHMATELNAYGASVAAAQRLGWPSAGAGGTVFWSSSWSKVDQQTRPPQEIRNFLNTNPIYAPKVNNPAYKK